MSSFIAPKALTAKPSSVIRSNYNAFSNMCHDLHEPILITRNGEGDLVVMSQEAYNDMIDRMQLSLELMEADHDLCSGAPTVPANDVFTRLRNMIHEHI
ncbi:MAG: type II toxin-antitoxin system Phd/YefM family antitoxin [Peptococcaceae bacterium]|nr:type II toxin-antitoxin system Phd/YefM family antitoxin [Peptococcaceae bacterium]